MILVRYLVYGKPKSRDFKYLIVSFSGLGCKRSWVQIPLRRPIYVCVTTDKSSKFRHNLINVKSADKCSKKQAKEPDTRTIFCTMSFSRYFRLLINHLTNQKLIQFQRSLGGICG